MQWFGRRESSNADPSQIPQINPPSSQTTLTSKQQKADDERAGFVKVVLADSEDIWTEIFKQSGLQYSDPTLVLYRDAVASACGNASAASGPLYCPNDAKLYIDLSFFEDMQNKLIFLPEFGHTMNKKRIILLRKAMSKEH